MKTAKPSSAPPSHPLRQPPPASAAKTDLQLRLLRQNDVPATRELDEPLLFGLQDTQGTILAPQRLPDGTLAFEFFVHVQPGTDPGQPRFTGRFASGPAHDRFVYLAWRSVPRGIYINRVKARLGSIDWPLIHAAQQAGRPLAADMTGWIPGDARKWVPWTLA